VAQSGPRICNFALHLTAYGFPRLSLLNVFIVEKLINPIDKNKLDPLLTSNNPAPIPGCHTPEDCRTQYCVPGGSKSLTGRKGPVQTAETGPTGSERRVNILMSPHLVVSICRELKLVPVDSLSNVVEGNVGLRTRAR